jgi:hypothetical protein
MPATSRAVNSPVPVSSLARAPSRTRLLNEAEAAAFGLLGGFVAVGPTLAAPVDLPPDLVRVCLLLAGQT